MPVTTAPTTTSRAPRPAARAPLAFALSLGVHLLFFGLLATTLEREPRPTIIPIELVFGPASLAPAPAVVERTDPADHTDTGAASATVPSREPDAAEPPVRRPRIARAALQPPRPAAPPPPSSSIDPVSLDAPRVALATPARALSADAGLELAVHDWLRRHQHYPRAARRAGLEGTATVRFVIDRAGALRARELVASSGHAALDRAALELLERAAPYPAWPARASLEAVELTLPVEYRLSSDATRG